jgi:conjugal transfer ATP-binding protein TraC
MLEKNKTAKEINIFDNVQNSMDLLLPDMLQEKQDYICLGYNKYSRVFVITVYPEQTWISWLNDLFYIGNINISVKIEPASNGNTISQLTKKLVQSQSEYATYSRQGNILHLPELEKQIEDLEDLRMLIQTNQDRLFFTTIFITLNAESLQELNEKTKVLESELNKKTAMIRVLNFRQLEGFKTMLPLGSAPILNYERNMVAGRNCNSNSNF